MGTAASHGCVRLDTASITWIGERIGPGVPVTITSWSVAGARFR